MRLEGRDDRVRILVRENSKHDVHRSALGEQIGEGGGSGRIVGAVDPGWDIAERAALQLLEPGRPSRRLKS